MNYYFDTEFIEDFTTRTFNIPSFRWISKKHYIELISIGIVSEDGREYYAVSKDFDLKHVWNKYDLQLPDSMGDEPKKIYWLRENVLKPLHKDLCKNISGDMKNVDYFQNLATFSYKSLKSLISIYGKTNNEIATDIRLFTSGVRPTEDMEPGRIEDVVNYHNKINKPTFYAYYADYDWVLFCFLFGRMIDLPAGYPMYCRDLKQMIDDMALEQWKVIVPKQTNEHYALEDARWNKKLHENILGYMKALTGY